MNDDAKWPTRPHGQGRLDVECPVNQILPCLTGVLLGGLLVCATVAGIAALGGLRALSVAPNSIIVLPLIMHITVSLIEEMMLRGIFFRVVQESLGSWLALLLSGLVFGGMHLINDNISVLGIAREVSALTGSKLKNLKIEKVNNLMPVRLF